MERFPRWTQILRETPFTARVHDAPVQEQVQALTRQCLDLWWSCDRTLPGFPFTYTPRQQAENEKKLDLWVNGLVAEMRRLPSGVEERQALEARLRPHLTDFAQTSLNLEPRHMDFIEATGMAGAMQAFARMARAFDPAIRAEDIYQAGRNVMTMNFFQLLLDLPVEVTPAVFAYSMLYPYTDNYLDDPAVTRTTKLAFNHRFEQRLKGEPVRPANASEETIGRLVSMVEAQWDRARYPQVYESLLAIHTAQARSLALVLPGAAPYEMDVLGISFEKGGASVLADGYLVAGSLTEAQAAFLFGYGAYTQLMDDLEDLEEDMREGRLTIFSQAAGRWPLDALTNRVIHFSRALFRDLNAFPSAAAGPMTELIERGIDPVLLDIAGRSAKYYSKNYLREIERYIPYRFASTRRQRETLARQKIAVEKLVELMI